MVKVTPLATGFVMGVWIAVGLALVKIYPPEVYTICMIGHPNDLFSYTLNHAIGTNFYIHPISRTFPMLTVVGILAGGGIAAYRHKEIRFSARLRDPIGIFVAGFLIANFGLILGFCPIKTTATVAYGSIRLLAGLLSIVGGCVLACEYIKWKVRR